MEKEDDRTGATAQLVLRRLQDSVSLGEPPPPPPPPAPGTTLVTSIVQIQHLELYIKQEESCREQESIKDHCPRQMQERSSKTGRSWRRPAETTMGVGVVQAHHVLQSKKLKKIGNLQGETLNIDSLNLTIQLKPDVSHIIPQYATAAVLMSFSQCVVGTTGPQTTYSVWIICFHCLSIFWTMK